MQSFRLAFHLPLQKLYTLSVKPRHCDILKLNAAISANKKNEAYLAAIFYSILLYLKLLTAKKNNGKNIDCYFNEP